VAYFEYVHTNVRNKGRVAGVIHMRAVVETMVKSKRWLSEESMALTTLDHVGHRSICIPVYFKVQVREDPEKKKELR
jgi:hypothetical protein